MITENKFSKEVNKVKTANKIAVKWEIVLTVLLTYLITYVSVCAAIFFLNEKGIYFIFILLFLCSVMSKKLAKKRTKKVAFAFCATITYMFSLAIIYMLVIQILFSNTIIDTVLGYAAMIMAYPGLMAVMCLGDCNSYFNDAIIPATVFLIMLLILPWISAYFTLKRKNTNKK